ncbi:TonB-dependent receptor, partial [Escherichia coli]|nr:TonB-dependent receptor [Escherichia coli]
SYSRGYKAGGFNLDRSAFKNPNPAQPLPIFPISLANAGYYADVLQFEEETVTAYEAGMKLSTRGFNLNVAGFRQEFSNFQLNTFNGTVYLVQNINGCKQDLGGGDRD